MFPGRPKCAVFTHRRWQSPGAAALSSSHLVSAGQNPAGLGPAPVAAWLVALDGLHRGEDFRLLRGRQSIGSAWDNAVVVTAPEMSLRHAELDVDERGVATVRGLAEHARVVVNGRAVAEERLADGDEVALGSARFLFRDALQRQPGYRPILRERPAVRSPAKADMGVFVTGWLVGKFGPVRGMDFRLLNGITRVGRAPGLEVSLLDHGLESHQFSIAFKDNQHVLVPIAVQGRFLLNGRPVPGPTVLRDSDEVECGTGTYFVKCL